MANDSKSLELQIRIATQEALRAVETLKGEIKALANEAGSFAKSEGEELKRSFKEAETAAKESCSSIGDIKNAIGSLTEVVAAGKALSFIKDLGSFALQTADNFQIAKNQFGILLGDMEQGAGLFNQIKDFNDKTPFDLDTLIQGTNVLVAAKVPLEDLQAQLTKFGDLSQGNSQRMTSYINAFSQAAAKGKADMQILNTYLNQGVPILDALAKNFGVTTAEVVEMSSQGKISFEDFSAALDELTAAGGRYFGGMELASTSLQAMKEGLQESVNSLSASFGEIFLPAANAVVEVLTAITNAINESPLLKGILFGAIVAFTGYLAAMAVKATIAFASQMALNFSIGALNPVVLATTIAVAGIAAGYVALSSAAQKAARDSENQALAMRNTVRALNDMERATDNYATRMSNWSPEESVRIQNTWRTRINQLEREKEEVLKQLQEFDDEIRSYGFDPLDEIYNYDRGLFTHEIRGINHNIQEARKELEAAERAARMAQSNRSQNVIEETPEVDENARRAAERWFAQWAEQYRRFKGEMENDPFVSLNIDFEKTMAEAQSHGASQAVINQINEYYGAERSKIINELKDEEERIAASISKTKLDDIQLQYQKELEAIEKLEQQRIHAAGNSEEEIAAIRNRFADMREELEINLIIDIDKTKIDEARESVKNWQEELSNNLLLAIMDLQMFSDQTSVILSDLSAQLIELSGSAALSGFEEFGRAMGEGANAAKSMQQALAMMCQQILNQLPMMFLQAGLQLIAQGQWALGLGFVAAAASSAIISGYVQGQSNATANAHGNVYDEYGKAAREFAAGGAFTNQIVNHPTYFRYGGSLGVMGEAGPEAIMPLKRMPSGNLGVESGGGAVVIVTVNNYSGVDVKQEETEDAEGNRYVNIDIGPWIDQHINSGKADRAMSRYGLRPQGV